ncbi:Methyltransferase type 11 [[Leptolyngbya] sp. PCC 7376]|uniref:class I SAM-dependent methyltransferase n=1 Tax=[Leptolyngbya] sp. PCC 7376 TaxID=111781 RepID=UPI00029F29AB|nr:methyltransferase domain-containing protein [[Leptolyngbya] sp. PCC 7376]AFY38577.1 Methyltransferase type 11 [[Leptolyngbya] sp. PCC 7376]
MSEYIHGYDPEEQQRLVEQAQYWSDRLFLPNLDLEPDAHILDIGCGVGAVLGIISQKYPDLIFAGVDLQPRQIAFATQYLTDLGLNFDLRAGDAYQLPWADNTFDFALTVWLLEHVPDTAGVLQEALRVLKSGGQICLMETDYQSLLVHPTHPDFEYFREALCELFFAANGNAYVGRSLGAYLVQAGFAEVNNEAIAFHYWQTPENEELRGLVNHIDTWLKLMIPQMVEKLGKDGDRLKNGLEHFRNVPNDPLGSITLNIYRATGTKL